MEIQEERQIEIFHTLEKIERMNKAIQFHQVQENQDKTAISQYQSVKQDLIRQLREILWIANNVLTLSEIRIPMTEKLVLTLNISDPSKRKAFMQMLQLFDFIQVEDYKVFLKRFIKNAPKRIPLSEEDIAKELMELRYPNQ